MLPTTEIQKAGRGLQPAVFVTSWIVLSTVTIIFNKYLISTLNFHFPAILTCWHMLFATVMTQLLSRYTTLLNRSKDVKMTRHVYVRAIVPIGILYSASLVYSNQVYLYLSVAFIQMLKASAPVAVLTISWLFRVASPNLKEFINISIIVFGVAIASVGEVKFVWLGFFYQLGGTFSEAVRLIMIQILLSGEGQNMDPLVSLYYYAPVCAITNFLVAAVTEFNAFEMAVVSRVGVGILVVNAAVAFALNIASVLLIGKTSGLVMTLCGVLKNILLIIASVLIWGTIISGLQLIGYGIALAGLVYYGVGYDGVVACGFAAAGFVRKMWETRRTKTILTAIYVAVAILLILGFVAKTTKDEGFAEQKLPDAP